MRHTAWAAIKSVSVLEHNSSKDENVALTDDCRSERNLLQTQLCGQHKLPLCCDQARFKDSSWTQHIL